MHEDPGQLPGCRIEHVYVEMSAVQGRLCTIKPDSGGIQKREQTRDCGREGAPGQTAGDPLQQLQAMPH